MSFQMSLPLSAYEKSLCLLIQHLHYAKHWVKCSSKERGPLSSKVGTLRAHHVILILAYLIVLASIQPPTVWDVVVYKDQLSCQ